MLGPLIWGVFILEVLRRQEEASFCPRLLWETRSPLKVLRRSPSRRSLSRLHSIIVYSPG